MKAYISLVISIGSNHLSNILIKGVSSILKKSDIGNLHKTFRRPGYLLANEIDSLSGILIFEKYLYIHIKIDLTSVTRTRNKTTVYLFCGEIKIFQH